MTAKLLEQLCLGHATGALPPRNDELWGTLAGRLRRWRVRKPGGSVGEEYESGGPARAAPEAWPAKEGLGEGMTVTRNFLVRDGAR